MQLQKRAIREQATTLAEVLTTVLIVAVFFASIFELNATCLRYISASKENISSFECVQDRIEQLRNMEFAKLIDPVYLTTNPPVSGPPGQQQPSYRNLTTPANESVLARQAIEEVTISTYGSAGATGPKVRITRDAGASIAAPGKGQDVNKPANIAWIEGTKFDDPSVVQIDVKYTWKTVFGSRQRSETSSTIVAAGTKK